jgi:hypothetical protein
LQMTQNIQTETVEPRTGFTSNVPSRERPAPHPLILSLSKDEVEVTNRGILRVHAALFWWLLLRGAHGRP